MPVEREAGAKPRTRSAVGARVFVEHRDLNAILAEVRASFDDRDAAAGTLERLADAFDVHFEQEDRLYYPAIWALRRERKDALLGFVRAHEDFRRRLEEISERLEGNSLGDAEQALEEFAQSFARHEVGEEELLRSLDAEIHAPG